MATYTYETIPQKPGEAPVRFEVRQSMMDDPLETHPDTGQPVRRIVTGGLGFIGGSKAGGGAPSPAGGHQHGPGCGFR